MGDSEPQQSEIHNGSPPKLDERANTQYELDIFPDPSGRVESLPLNKLSPTHFERLCRLIIRLECQTSGWSEIYGGSGHTQHGIDIYTFNGKLQQYEAYQCKRYEPGKFTRSTFDKAVTLFVRKWQLARGEQPSFTGLGQNSQVSQKEDKNPPDWFKEIKKFIVCVTVAFSDGTTLSDARNDLAILLKKEKIDLELEVWDFNHLNIRLRELPRVVEEFFGIVGVERFCLESVAKPYLEQYRNRTVFGRFPNYSPLEYTVFGREEKLEEIVQAIQTHRHVQVVGFPGVGKSTLLYSFAVKQCQQWQVALVDMRMISDKIEIKDQLEAIALTAIQHFDPEFQGKALAKAKEVFQGENTCLILDNLEDTALLEQVRKKLNPQKLLVSSRERTSALKVEVVALKHLASTAAEAMFREQGQVPSGHDTAIAQICTDLGYLPLAIKLVASFYRSYGLSLEQVAQEVSRDLDPGATQQPSTTDRQRAEHSVRVAFELSYQKLTKAKNAFLAFGILSPNGATCGSVAYVLDAKHIDAWKQLQDLKNLSLVEVVADYNLQASEVTNSEDTQAHTFFRTHKLLGQFAREKLEQDPATQASLDSRVRILLQDALSRTKNHQAGYQLNPDLKFICLHREQIRLWGILQLTRISPERNLVSRIGNLSLMIGDSGHQVEAFQLDLEIVAFFRNRIQSDRAAFLPGLGLSLTNLSGRQSQLGDRKGGLATAQEAVEIYRELIAYNRDSFLPDLALILTNLSNLQNQVGNHEEALTAIQEAISICRELVTLRGDAFLPDLAMGLNNLSLSLNDIGEHDRSITASQEAVKISRELVKHNREVFLPLLALSLNNLSNRQGEVGDREAALTSIQEAVDIRRKLVAYNRNAFISDLASSLANLSTLLREVGDFKGALYFALEALNLQLELYKLNAPAFSQNLVNYYGVLGNAYEGLGNLHEARVSAEQGLRVLLPMLQTYPHAFARVAQAIGGQYYRRSQKLQREPDMQLLGQVEAVLKSLQPKEVAR